MFGSDNAAQPPVMTIRPRPRWDGGHALLYFVFAAMLSLLLGLVLVDPLGFYWSVVVAEIAAFALIPFVLSRIFDLGWSTWFSRPKLNLAFWWWTVIAVVTFAITHSNLPVLLDRLWPIPEQQFELYREYLSADSPSQMLLLVLVAAILPGICEEIAFRGVVQTGLRRSFGPTHAIVWGGAMFALLHLNPWNFIGLWVFGCLLGYLRERTGSILPSMAAHALNNTLALVTFSMQTPEDWEAPLEFIPWYLVIPCGILLVVSVFQIYRHSRKMLMPQPLAPSIPSVENPPEVT